MRGGKGRKKTEGGEGRRRGRKRKGGGEKGVVKDKRLPSNLVEDVWETDLKEGNAQ